jgi:hypothetical protein
MWTYGQTDLAELRVPFHNFANPPKKLIKIRTIILRCADSVGCFSVNKIDLLYSCYMHQLFICNMSNYQLTRCIIQTLKLTL